MRDAFFPPQKRGILGVLGWVPKLAQPITLGVLIGSLQKIGTLISMAKITAKSLETSSIEKGLLLCHDTQPNTCLHFCPNFDKS
jgi:hypothetical protein